MSVSDKFDKSVVPIHPGVTVESSSVVQFKGPVTAKILTDGSDDGDDGDGGVGSLTPDEVSEYEQRVKRRGGEAKYGEHVDDPRAPGEMHEDLDSGAGMGMNMGSGLMSHPLLADMPQGADSLSPLDRLMAAESDATRMELKRQLENKKRAEMSHAPTYTRG